MASMYRLVPAEPPPSGLQRHIEEFHEFFRSRGVSFGSAGDLPPFAERLAADVSFRDDVASLVRTVIYRERDGLSRLELVELVTTAVVGPEVEHATAPEVREGIRQVMAFVEGVFRSRWNPGAAAKPASDRPEGPQLPNDAGSPGADLSAAPTGETAPAESVQHPPHPNGDLFYRAQVVAGVQPAEAIAQERKGDAESGVDSAPLPTFAQGSHREVLVAEDPARPAWRPWMWACIACALVLAFCAGLFVHKRLLIPLRDPNQPYETPPPEANETLPPQRVQSAPPVVASTPETKSLRVVPRTGSARGHASALPSRSAEAARDDDAATLTAPEVLPKYMAPARVGASPALMTARLVYAPPADYPKMAKLAHIQGRVMVEAVVGQDGSVIRAEAVSGHHLLRGAAVREVYGRRYQPYLLNGRPTDVATIMTIDFRLH